jgi:hypothetical protein
VFGVLAERLADLMALAEAVGFRRLDPRLAAKRLGHDEVRHATHRALGDEPGSVCEIASRAGCAPLRARRPAQPRLRAHRAALRRPAGADRMPM